VRSTQLVPKSESENIPERLSVEVSPADNVSLIKPERESEPTRKRTFEAMTTNSPIKSTPSSLKRQKKSVKVDSPPETLVRNQSPKVKCESPSENVVQNRCAKFKYETTPQRPCAESVCKDQRRIATRRSRTKTVPKAKDRTKRLVPVAEGRTTRGYRRTGAC
jgi:hypothetical protein